jgi:probable HAF family extracellular repeat protein
MKTLLLALALLLLLSNLTPEPRAAGAAPRYSVRDLGTFHPGFQTVAAGINNSGAIAGQASTADPGGKAEGPYHPFLFTHGQIQDLGLLPGFDWGTAVRINDRGQILVYQYTFSPPDAFLPTFFLYTEGRMINLGELIGDPNAGPISINNHDAIVGTVGTPGTNAYTAFIYTNGVLTRLGGLVPGGNSYAADINDSGDIVGWADSVAGSFYSFHAVLFSNGQITDLGVHAGLEASSAYRINRFGHVMGNSQTATPERTRGFLYRDGHMTDIGALPGDRDSLALDFNNFDQIVGTSWRIENDAYVFRPFVYINGAIWEIQTLIPPQPGWTLQAAVGINDAGQILVVAATKLGFQRTWLLTPR